MSENGNDDAHLLIFSNSITDLASTIDYFEDSYEHNPEVDDSTYREDFPEVGMLRVNDFFW